MACRTGYSPSSTRHLSFAGFRLLDLDQLNLKDECRARRYDLPRPTIAIAESGRDDQLPLAADLHALQAFVPALDDHARAQFDRPKRLATIDAAIELLAVLKSAGVMHDDFGAFLRFL